MRTVVAAVLVLAFLVARSRIGDARQEAGGRVESVTGPGKPLHLAWPSEGQAAVAIEGLGALGTSGGERSVPIATRQP